MSRKTELQVIALTLSSGHHGFKRWVSPSKDSRGGWRDDKDNANNKHPCENDLWLCSCCGYTFCPEHGGPIYEGKNLMWLENSEDIA